ncbi:protein phosphatase regulator [Tilletia horrida]|nr:protein phosphatase regulator [Tilletia horrida]
MLSAPAPYPTVSSSIPAPDDAQIVPSHRLPSICVDYLSHNWARDEDVWNSWKAMTKSKNEIANGVRLENASWRTWMKQMRNLKTVSPETLNWLKDSDVTWLYGPLHQGQVEAVPPPKIASTTDRLDLESSRPALKSGVNSTSARSLPKTAALASDNKQQQQQQQQQQSQLQSKQQGTDSTSTTASTVVSPPVVSRHVARASTSNLPSVARKSISPTRLRSGVDGSTSPPLTKSILKHRTIQDLLNNPQANSAAGLGSSLGLRTASQPSLSDLEAAAAATSLALNEGASGVVLSPNQARALNVQMGVSSPSSEIGFSDHSSAGPTPPVTSPTGEDSTSSAATAAGPPPPGILNESSDAETASSLKSPTASAASLVSLSSVGSATNTTAQSSSSNMTKYAVPKTQLQLPEKRHISFNQRVEQCIALDMDHVQDYADSDDDGHGQYGYHEDDDDDEEESIMWRSGPGQTVQRRGQRGGSQHLDDDDEEEMLTINVRSSAKSKNSSSSGGGARPSSSSGGSSTSATSFSTHRSRSSHSIPRTIAKLAPTMLRGGSTQPETGEWLHSPDGTNGGISSADGDAYVHNPIVNVDRDEIVDEDDEMDQHGGYGGGVGQHHASAGGPEYDHDLVDDDDDRGRAPEPTGTYHSASYGGGSGRVHQSGRYSKGGAYYSGGGGPGSGPATRDSYEFGSDGDWENRNSLDLASPTFPASPEGEREDVDDDEDEEEEEDVEVPWTGENGPPADEVELRSKAKSGKSGAGGRGSNSSSSANPGRRSADGAKSQASSASGGFWADGERINEPASPASSTTSSFSSGSRGGSRRKQSATEVAKEDMAVHGALSIDVDNVPSNDPNSPVNPAHGPTPLNTPTFLLGGKPGKGATASAKSRSKSRAASGGGSAAGSSSSRKGRGPSSRSSAAAASAASVPFDDEDDEDDYDPASAVLPHRRPSTGALVAPKNRQVQVPLAHDYVDEGDEGGLINRAVEMINTARDLFGALWGAGDSDRGRSWRDSTYE